jgi:hypothetical protein
LQRETLAGSSDRGRNADAIGIRHGPEPFGCTMRKGLAMGGGLGTLIVSIELELDIDRQNGVGGQRLDQIRGELVEMTRASAIPATWAVADPALSAATEPILAAGCDHEIAVLGDRAWIGPGCGRVRLDRELARRFTAARQGGVPVSTLVLRNVEQVPDLDLLLDHGVAAIRSPAVATAAETRRQAAPPIRFGIWHPPRAWAVPARSAWWAPAAWLLHREIKRAIRRGQTLHLAIDAPRLMDASQPPLETIATTLRYAAARRDAGQLAIQTIGQLAAEALQSRAALPSRSILRPAA